MTPQRGDFDPIAIPDLLPYLGLVEVIWSASERRFEDLRFRLIGTYIGPRENIEEIARGLPSPGLAQWSDRFHSE